MDNLIDRIRFIMSEKNLNQTKLGNCLGINPASVSMWLSGRTNPSSQTIQQICDKFGYNPEWLATGKGDPIRSQSRADQLTEALGRALRRQDSASTRLIGSIALVLEKLDDDQIATVLKSMADIIQSYSSVDPLPSEDKKLAAARSGDRVEVLEVSREAEEAALPPPYSGDI